MPFIDLNKELALEQFTAKPKPETPKDIGLLNTIRYASQEVMPIVELSNQFRQDPFNRNPERKPIGDRTYGTELSFDPIDRANEMLLSAGIPGENQDLEDFLYIENERDFERLMAIKQQSFSQRQQLTSTGLSGTMAILAAGAVDPLNALAFGSLLKSVRTGKVVADSAVAGAVSAGSVIAADELGLQAISPVRSTEETILNIGIGTLLGGTLGAGIGAAQKSAAKSIKNTVMTDDLPPPVRKNSDMYALDAFDKSIGAAQADVRTPEGQKIARGIAESTIGKFVGKAATSAILKTTGKANPVVRLAESNNLEVSKTIEDLVDVNFTLEKNVPKADGDLGQVTQPSVEGRMEFWDIKKVKAYEEFDKTYKAYKQDIKKQGEIPLSPKDFNTEVFTATIEGDVHSNPHVQDFARKIRKDLIDPIAKEADELGLFEEFNIGPDKSWMHRVYNKEAIKNYQVEWRQRIKKYGEETFTADRAAAERLAKQKKDTGEFTADAIKAQEDLRIKLDIDNLDQYLEDFADDITKQLLGVEHVTEIHKFESKIRGPLKGRTFNIATKDLLKIDVGQGKQVNFVETNMMALMDRVTRVMGPQIELQRKFGTTKFDEVASKINDRARADIEKIELNKDLTDAQKNKQIKKIRDDQIAGVRDLNVIWDLLKGTYHAQSQSVDTLFGRASSNIRKLVYMSRLGGVVRASIPDLANIAFRDGVTQFFGKGLPHLIKRLGNKEYRQLSKKQARESAVAAQTVLNSRIAGLYGVGDPYNFGNAAERTIDNMARQFSKANAIVYWNDAMEEMTFSMASQRLARLSKSSSVSRKDRIWLNEIGIDESSRLKIAEQLKKYEREDAGLPQYNTDIWEDVGAQRAFRLGLSKEVKRTIVRKGVADVPIFSNTGIGKLLTQFMNFAFAQQTRILIPAMQRADANTLAAVTMMFTLGAMSYSFRELAGGREPAEDPSAFALESIDASGLLSVPFLMNIFLEPAGLGVSRLEEGNTKHNQMRTSQRLYGASAGYMTDTFRLLSELSDFKYTQGDIDSLRRVMPYQNVLWLKPLIDGGTKELGQITGAKQKGNRGGNP